MRRRLAALAVLTAAAAALGLGSATPAAAPPSLSFRVFAQTGLPLGDIVWTGRRFLYVTETTGQISVGGPAGLPLQPFAMLPREVEEARCLPSPGKHGFGAGDVFCHAPHGTVWKIGPDGSTSVFATLPETDQQDGTLAFDSGGGFGYVLLASTGGSASDGGTVYAIGPDASVRRVGSYPGPGGADNIELGPARFGSASNQLLLAIDRTAAPGGGAVLAMRADGTVRRLVSLRDGINPIAVIGRGDAPRGAAAAGLYLTDTNSQNVYFLPAAQLRAYTGAVIVGAEASAQLWIIRPSGSGFRAVRAQSNLGGGGQWNLEGAAYVP